MFIKYAKISKKTFGASIFKHDGKPICPYGSTEECVMGEYAEHKRDYYHPVPEAVAPAAEVKEGGGGHPGKSQTVVIKGIKKGKDTKYKKTSKKKSSKKETSNKKSSKKKSSNKKSSNKETSKKKSSKKKSSNKETSKKKSSKKKSSNKKSSNKKMSKYSFFGEVSSEYDKAIFYVYFYKDIQKAFREVKRKCKSPADLNLDENINSICVNYYHYLKDLRNIVKNRDKLVKNIQQKYDRHTDFNQKYKNYKKHKIHLTSLDKIVKKLYSFKLKEMNEELQELKIIL